MGSSRGGGLRLHLADHSPERGQRLTLLQELWGGWLHSYAYVGEQGWNATESYWEYLLKLHFADASTDRGQLRLLANEAGNSSLFSYAYKDSSHFYKPFEDYWSELVRLHLAGLPSSSSAIQSEVLPQIESHLTTYAHQHEVTAKEKAFDMRLHLTDTTARLHGKTSVKQLLPQEGAKNHLFSAAYPDQESQWADAWRPPTGDSTTEDMHLHIAGHSATAEMDAAVKPEHQNHLATQIDRSEVLNTVAAVQDLRPRVIIDSGAFTAFTTGKVINPRDYAKWALEFKQKWEHKMAALHFMNLDVIGDQDASWVNQEILEGLGLKPLPIITYGAEKRHLERALQEYPYIALGGLVPHSRDKTALRKWLDHCFAMVMKQKKKTGILPRIHLLGITTDWVLKRYPCYSSDSSTWVACLRFGGGAAAGIKQLPRYKESDAAMAATIHTLRSEIRKYKKMEAEATKLWASRGIVFDD